MLKDLADFPQLIETLINSVIGFLYRTLGTFWATIRSPRYGSLRVFVSKSGLQPLTALFLSSSLLSVSSILFPGQVSGMIAKREADVVSWLIYAFALLLSTDATISLAIWLGWRRGRQRERARAMLRYAASFAITGTFLIALEWRWQTNTIFEPGPFGYQFPVKPWWFDPLFQLLASLPLLGTAGTLAGLSTIKQKLPAVWRPRPSRRTPWLQRPALLLPLLFLTAIFHLPAKYLMILDIPHTLAEKKLEKDFSKDPFGPGSESSPAIRPAPVTCESIGHQTGTFSAGLSNTTKKPLLINLSDLRIHVLEKDISLLDPKDAALSTQIAGPSVVAIAPMSATVITGRFKLPAHGAPLNLKACFFAPVQSD